MPLNAEFISGRGQVRDPRRVVVMGPPGSGKSTIGGALAKSMGVPLISTGDLLRNEAEQGSDLGLEARPYLDSGQYAPDDLVTRALGRRLGAPDASAGFVLDGFPRTPEQASALDRLAPADEVLYLNLSEEESRRRILNRGKTSGRSDDNDEVITERLKTYQEKTKPVKKVFSDKGILTEIDAENPWQLIRNA
jgi:adenylate kinase